MTKSIKRGKLLMTMRMGLGGNSSSLVFTWLAPWGANSMFAELRKTGSVVLVATTTSDGPASVNLTVFYKAHWICGGHKSLTYIKVGDATWLCFGHSCPDQRCRSRDKRRCHGSSSFVLSLGAAGSTTRRMRGDDRKPRGGKLNVVTPVGRGHPVTIGRIQNLGERAPIE